MCDVNCITFGAINLSEKEINNKRVIEIGSNNVNGGLRSIIESWNPSEYIGVDIERGSGVDVICSAENVVNVFGKESFDIVISTEMLEHVQDWRLVISNIKKVCKPNGIILITTRSHGFAYHGWPYDFWRYEIEDMERIFSDCIIEKLEGDDSPGVFIKARKPSEYKEGDLSEYDLYSITENKRINQNDEKTMRTTPAGHHIKEGIKDAIRYVGKTIFKV